jgi:hypothetical protein
MWSSIFIFITYIHLLRIGRIQTTFVVISNILFALTPSVSRLFLLMFYLRNVFGNLTN